jgi:hypothetical protein
MDWQSLHGFAILSDPSLPMRKTIMVIFPRYLLNALSLLSFKMIDSSAWYVLFFLEPRITLLDACVITSPDCDIAIAATLHCTSLFLAVLISLRIVEVSITLGFQ